MRASVEFSDYLRALSRERRAEPTGDLISEMTSVVDDGDRLTEDELIGTCVLLLNAGHEATVNVTGNGWWSLFRHPDALARLRAEPALVPRRSRRSCDGTPRCRCSSAGCWRTSRSVACTIPRGSEFGLLFGSANRDPAVFADPDAFDVDREPNPHVTFGAGIHFCLGAPLARFELQTSFSTVLRGLPDLELVEEPTWKPNYIIRGLERLLVSA